MLEVGTSKCRNHLQYASMTRFFMFIRAFSSLQRHGAFIIQHSVLIIKDVTTTISVNRNYCHRHSKVAYCAGRLDWSPMCRGGSGGATHGYGHRIEGLNAIRSFNALVALVASSTEKKWRQRRRKIEGKMQRKKITLMELRQGRPYCDKVQNGFMEPFTYLYYIVCAVTMPETRSQEHSPFFF